MYTIAAAEPCHLPLLPAIELAAASLLAGHAPASVLAETTSQADLEQAQQRGQLWIALSAGVPVGFALVKVLEPRAAHLEEIDVYPEHGRRGLGRRLVIAVCRWAAANGYSYVTLTTFRDVPWNMPFYARLGFEEIPSEEISPALSSVIDEEIRRGLDRRRRVVMRRPCLLDKPTDTHPLAPVVPTPDEVQYLEDRIYEFNSGATGIDDGELLAFFVRERDRIVAGICGNTWGGTCELRQFWVDESHRHRGLGTQLFEAAEQEARRRGCVQVVLMTFSFQAPAFYERHGFDVVATIQDHPLRHRNLLMRKRLNVE